MFSEREKKRLGRRIKAARTYLKLSQSDLAERVGATKQCIQLWEAGKTAPSALYLPALSKAFGVSTDVILGIR